MARTRAELSEDQRRRVAGVLEARDAARAAAAVAEEQQRRYGAALAAAVAEGVTQLELSRQLEVTPQAVANVLKRHERRQDHDRP